MSTSTAPLTQTGVLGKATGEIVMAALTLGATSNTPLATWQLAEGLQLGQYHGTSTVTLTDGTGPYFIEARKCTAATLAGFNAATDIGAVRLPRQPYSGDGSGAYYAKSNWFLKADLEAITMNTDAVILSGGLLNVLTSLTPRQLTLLVRDISATAG